MQSDSCVLGPIQFFIDCDAKKFEGGDLFYCFVVENERLVVMERFVWNVEDHVFSFGFVYFDEVIGAPGVELLEAIVHVCAES